jgi:AbrB family looped-hinge helix DNA binding protein
MAVQVAITPSGRMSLPADIRKRLGLASGGTVYIEETDGGVMLRTVPQIVAHARALAKQFADVPGASVADFLDARVVESGE